MKNKVINTVVRTGKTIVLPVSVYILFIIISKGIFGTPESMITILQQTVVSSIMAWGMCFCFKTGLWDFSAGSVVILSAIVGGHLAVTYNLGIVGLVIISVLCGLVCGCLTGAVFTIFKIPSIVTSIGMLLIYETMTGVLFNAKGATISPNMREIGLLGKSPYIFIVGLIALAIAVVIYNYTSFGYHVRAVGNSAIISQNNGLNSIKVRMLCFVIAGIFLGIAGFLTISIKGAITAQTNMATMSLAFDAIMGIFLGLYLSKNCNLMLGIFVGGLTMKLIGAGLLTLGLTSSLQDVVKGVLMIFFIGLASSQGKLNEILRSLKKQRAVRA